MITYCGHNSVVWCHLAKVEIVGLNPIARFSLNVVPDHVHCGCSSVVESLLPKQTVIGSIPIIRSSFKCISVISWSLITILRV